MRRLHALTTVAGLLLLAAGAPAGAATAEVVMKDNVFVPDEVAVQPGDTVTWVNQGRSPHNVTYGDGSRSSGTLAPGESHSITFDEPMTLYYYCSLHSSGSGKGMAGIVRVGTGGPVVGAPERPKPGGGTGPRVRRVPAEYPTIQKAVDAARPGDVVLVSPGVYREQVTVTTPGITLRGLDRNRVIIDGEFERAMGVLVQEADDVVVENMTARNTTLNNFYWTGVDGFRGSYLTSYNSGDYGIYSFDSQHGVFEDSWASGSLDSGFYIGQCQPCHQVIRRVKATLNGLGYSGTNAGGDLVIADSEWWDNFGGGITPNTLDTEENPPQHGMVITGNHVHGNHNLDAPYKDPAFASVYGVGIALMGGDDNVVTGNRVEDHALFGILVQPIPGIGPAGDVPLPVTPTGNVYRAHRNRIEGNTVSGSGMADLAMGAPAGEGNCFGGNTFDTSLPAAIETLHACGGAGSATGGDANVTAAILANYVAAESGERPPGDWRTQPPPPPQPNMPDAATVRFRPIGTVGTTPPATGGTAALPRTGAGAPFVPLGAALLAGSAGWAVLRELRVVRRR